MRESEIGESVKNSKYIPIRNRVSETRFHF